MRHRHVILATMLLLCATPAQAQFNVLPEIRGGLFARGVDGGGSMLDPTRIGDANVELLFNTPDLNAWTVIGELRPHLGATVSMHGQDAYAYAGLSWTVQAPIVPVFVEASLGGVARSGLVSAPGGDPARNLGCGLGLRAAGSVGLNLPMGTSLVATVEHLPDFGRCGAPARAATNIGLRVGFRF